MFLETNDVKLPGLLTKNSHYGSLLPPHIRQAGQVPAQQGVPQEQPLHHAPAGGGETPLRHGPLPQLLLRQNVTIGQQAGQPERQLLHLKVQAALPRDLHRIIVHNDD